jgi:hypothetical protein
MARKPASGPRPPAFHAVEPTVVKKRFTETHRRTDVPTTEPTAPAAKHPVLVLESKSHLPGQPAPKHLTHPRRAVASRSPRAAFESGRGFPTLGNRPKRHTYGDGLSSVREPGRTRGGSARRVEVEPG